MVDGSQFKHFIEGARVYLREVRPSDVNENYHRWMNDEEVTQFLEARFSDTSMEGIRKFVEQMAGSKDNLFLAIVVKDGDRHIGNIKLGPVSRAHGFADIGIMIGDRESWGKGYATEAIRLLADYAFKHLKLHKLTAGCYAPNLGSKKAFLKAGFSEEGVRRQQFKYKGEYVDDLLFGLVNPDWAGKE